VIAASIPQDVCLRVMSSPTASRAPLWSAL